MKRPTYVTDKSLKQFIKNALEEDIQSGDHSTLSTIPKELVQSAKLLVKEEDRKSTRLNSSHSDRSRMPSSA